MGCRRPAPPGGSSGPGPLCAWDLWPPETFKTRQLLEVGAEDGEGGACDRFPRFPPHAQTSGVESPTAGDRTDSRVTGAGGRGCGQESPRVPA